MIKKGISLILFCFYFVFAYAQDNVQNIDNQSYASGESINIWSIIGYILFGITVGYLTVVYVNKRKQKSQQQQISSNQEEIKPKRVESSTSNEAQTVDRLDDLDVDDQLQLDIEESSILNGDGSDLPRASYDNRKCTILIIEDHKDIRLYMKILFTDEYNLLMAENGEEGLKLARRELPDLVITDVMMPMMNGFECCKRIKEDLKTCHIPVIVLTALIGDEDVVKGIDLGADDYILKPFNPEILKSKVKRLIKSRQELKHIYTRLLMPAVGNASESKADSEEKPQDPFVAKIVQIVENNMQNPDFSVKRLSEMLNMSQPTLYRRVKLLTNFTIIELVRGIRLKRSAELLRSKQYNVQEVAELVGYNDIPTFRKHFVDFYGTTPSTFVRDD